MLIDILKKISKHTLLYSLGGIVSRMVGFLMIPLYTHYLTPSDYGIIELLDLTSVIIGMVIGVGMGMTLIRFYYEFDDQIERNEVVSTAIFFTFSTGLIVLGGLFYFSEKISMIVFQSKEYSSYLEVVFTTLCLGILTQMPLSYVRAKQQSLKYTIISLIQLIFGLSLNIYLIAGLHMGVWGLLYSNLISNGIIGVVLMAMTIFEVKIRFSFKKLKTMLKYGLPLVPASFGMFILTFSDRFFLQRYATLSEVGVYSLGYKFGMGISILITSPFLLFWAAYMYEIAKMENAKEIFSRIQLYFTFILIFSALGLSVIADDLIRIMSPSKYWDASKVLPIIALSYVFLGLNYFFHIGMNLTKKTAYRAYGVGISAILNLALNFLLIPPYGAMGAAWATLLSFIFMAAMNYFFSQRLYPINYEYSRVFKMLAIALVIFGFSKILPATSLTLDIMLKTILFINFPLILWMVDFYREEEKEKIRDFFSIFTKRVRILLP